MKRLLLVSGDRDFALEVAEALTTASDTAVTIDITSEDTAPWEVARAQTGLEAVVLIERGGRPFDALVVDTPLPDQSALALMSRIRRTDTGRTIPSYLLIERGQQSRVRRMMSQFFASTRFLDKPVDVETLTTLLAQVENQLQVVLAEYDDDRRTRYVNALSEAGYRVEAVSKGWDAIARQPRLRSDAVVANLQLPDLSGLTVCDQIRQAAVTPAAKVILYGSPIALSAQQPHHEAEPDDFLPAPFDEALLVERLAALIGQTRGRLFGRRSLVPATEDLPPDAVERLKHGQ